jgi:1-acyl-sn-glycerol-3-phosphate acyltransferase
VSKAPGRRKLTPAYRLAAGILRPPLMAVTRRDWSGAENLPTDAGYVVCPNHISHVDPLVFAHFLFDNGHVPLFLGKVEAFNVPVVGAILRGAEQIPVYRETGQASGAYRAAVAAVEDGRCVAIYPEGTLTRDPDLWPMRGKTGAARVALQTRCPVIPVAQWGPQRILGPYATWPDLFPLKTMQVRAGAPVPLEDLYDQAMTRQVLARATARIMRAIAAELQVLRGGTPPEELWDPRQHGQSTMGRPHQRPHHQRPHRRHPSREDPA